MTDNYSEDTPKPEKEDMSPQDEKDLDMEMNEEDTDIYEDDGSEKLQEDDEISPQEEGYMKGAAKEGEDAKCRECGEVLVGHDFIEKEINDDVMRFCSDECVEKYEETHTEE